MQQEPFIIHSVQDKVKIPLYEIRPLDSNEPLIGTFMNHELTPLDSNSKFSFKSVIRRKNNGQDSLITFHGLPDQFNEWIPSQELSQIIENGNDAVFTPLLKYINQPQYE